MEPSLFEPWQPKPAVQLDPARRDKILNANLFNRRVPTLLHRPRRRENYPFGECSFRADFYVETRLAFGVRTIFILHRLGKIEVLKIILVVRSDRIGMEDVVSLVFSQPADKRARGGASPRSAKMPAQVSVFGAFQINIIHPDAQWT